MEKDEQRLLSSHFASLHHVAHSQMCKKASCLARRHNGVTRAASLAATFLVAACYQCYLLQWPVQCAKHEASNAFHPSVFLSLSLLRSAQTAESRCDRFLSEVVKSYRQMATIKFVSVSTSLYISPVLPSSPPPRLLTATFCWDTPNILLKWFPVTATPANLPTQFYAHFWGGYPHHNIQIMFFLVNHYFLQKL